MDPSSLPPLALFVGVALALVVWQAVRHAVVRRLALRNVRRRPTEAALVVAGSLLGTALITGSFIVGDTLDSSIRVTAHTQLGPIDETISIEDRARAAGIERRLARLEDERIDGVVSFVAVPASFTSGAEQRRAEPDAQLIELDFERARGFGGDPSATGIRGETPAAGEVAITVDLAERLDVGIGDRLSGYVYGAELDLEVVRVLPRVGLAGYWQGFESSSANAFVAPRTIDALTSGGGPARSAPPLVTIAVSNRGGVEEGAALTAAVTRLIERSIGDDTLRVDTPKQERLQTADEQGDQFREIFVGIGAFAIVAGILLLVNIFVMLAEERKAQLGMLRAVGMRRGDLVRGFVIEGALYALIAGVLGALLGIAVGWVIVRVTADIFAGFGDFALELSFDFEPASVAGGFCIGLLISLVTVAGTSFRISRINIIRAIRDLPDPLARNTGLRVTIGGILLASLAAAWFLSSLRTDAAWSGLLLAPPLIAFGLLSLGARLVGRRAAVLLASSFSLFWGIFGNSITGEKLFASGAISAFVAQGILLTFSAVVLLSQTHETFEGALRRFVATRLALRLGIAYPLARRVRTGLTLGMYALVLFTMVFIAVLSTVFGGQVEATTKKAAGGFDMFVTANPGNPPSERQLEAVEGVDDAVTLTRGHALFLPRSRREPEPWAITGAGKGFVDVGPPLIGERAEGFSSDDEVWRTLLADPATAVIDSFFLQGGGGPPEPLVEPGETMMVIDPVSGRSAERRVLATVDTDASFAGVYVSRASLRAILGRRAAPSFFYLTTEPDADPADAAAKLQGEFFRRGVEATSFRQTIEEFARSNLQFMRLMQGYLALGLVVGIAGLGVVMVRAVRERRRAIGVLRSLGFESSRIRLAFLLESSFVALQGILVGAALAMVTARQLVATGELGEGVAFQVPWGQVTLITGLALAFSLLATAWPAQQASRIPPAVALRIAE